MPLHIKERFKLSRKPGVEPLRTAESTSHKKWLAGGIGETFSVARGVASPDFGLLRDDSPTWSSGPASPVRKPSLEEAKAIVAALGLNLSPQYGQP